MKTAHVNVQGPCAGPLPSPERKCSPLPRSDLRHAVSFPVQDMGSPPWEHSSGCLIKDRFPDKPSYFGQPRFGFPKIQFLRQEKKKKKSPHSVFISHSLVSTIVVIFPALPGALHPAKSGRSWIPSHREARDGHRKGGRGRPPAAPALKQQPQNQKDEHDLCSPSTSTFGPGAPRPRGWHS